MVAIFSSTITGSLYAFANATRSREARLRSLYRVSRTLSETLDQNEMLQSAAREIEEFFKVPILLITADASNKIRVGGSLIRPNVAIPHTTIELQQKFI